MSTKSISLVVLGCLSFSSQAAARIDRWSANVIGDVVSVTDCSDCGDDVGLLVMCGGDAEAAKLSVPFLAQDKGQISGGGEALLSFDIDGEKYELPAIFEEWAMIGFVPVASLARSSGLATRIRRGRTVDIELDGRHVSLGLIGSATALAIFDRHCGWGDGAAQVNGTGPGGFK